MFHDRASVTVIAGRGGDGSIHFRREKFVPKGGPDGGDGGDGGDVVLVADPRRRDLSAVRPNQKVNAGRGGAGSGSLSSGERGEDAVLHVPVGTQVLDAEERLIADLVHPGARVVVAKGGTGGRGNKRFATPTRQTPRFAEVGIPGQEGRIDLRLKLLADAAFVGLPNAGKSSLLTRISNARPKVAEYPFTTLSPVLGTVEASDGRQLVVADVPGLIEGASEGVGLGHEFLAHLERARVLLHAIDSSEGDADERWRTIDAELAAYGAGLDERRQVVVLNKTDLSPDPPDFGIEDERIIRVFRVSAATGAGIEELRRALFELVPQEEVAQAPRLPAGGGAPLLPRLSHRDRLPRHREAAGARAARGDPQGGRRARGRRGAARRRGAGVAAVGLYGGAFDPPHLGHVAVAEAAKAHFGLPRLVVLVAAVPGHKEVHAPAEMRLELARAAFPDEEVRLDPHPRTIDLLRAERFDDPLLVIGADQFDDFLSWKEPGAVLELARLAVATRPGYPRARTEVVLRELDHPERVVFFDLEPNPAASRDVRALAAAGKPLDRLVPSAVAALIEAEALYRSD